MGGGGYVLRSTGQIFDAKPGLIEPCATARDLGRYNERGEGGDTPDLYDVRTVADGPTGALPLTADFLRDSPSGDVGLSQKRHGVGGVEGRDQFLILSTQGVSGRRRHPRRLGYHTGHWEAGLLVREAALGTDRLAAAAVSDPCDGRSQGTTGMFDSLPYRNDAAIVLRRLVRSLPRRRG